MFLFVGITIPIHDDTHQILFFYLGVRSVATNYNTEGCVFPG